VRYIRLKPKEDQMTAMARTLGEAENAEIPVSDNHGTTG